MDFSSWDWNKRPARKVCRSLNLGGGRRWWWVMSALGLAEEELAVVEQVVEIPVFGRPFAYNVHTAVAMAVYEYCRQYPRG